jgi:hypothetical protein
MALAVEDNESPNPTDVGFLGAGAVVERPQPSRTRSRRRTSVCGVVKGTSWGRRIGITRPPAHGSIDLIDVSYRAAPPIGCRPRRTGPSWHSRRVAEVPLALGSDRTSFKARSCSLLPTAIRNIRTTLSTILSSAVKWGYLAAMPRLPNVKVDDPQWEWYRAEEARRLVAAARDEWFFPLATGARMGEQIATRWGDIDWVVRMVHIRQSAPAGGTRHRATTEFPARRRPLLARPPERRQPRVQASRGPASPGRPPSAPLRRGERGEPARGAQPLSRSERSERCDPIGT